MRRYSWKIYQERLQIHASRQSLTPPLLPTFHFTPISPTPLLQHHLVERETALWACADLQGGNRSSSHTNQATIPSPNITSLRGLGSEFSVVRPAVGQGGRRLRAHGPTRSNPRGQTATPRPRGNGRRQGGEGAAEEATAS